MFSVRHTWIMALCWQYWKLTFWTTNQTVFIWSYSNLLTICTWAWYLGQFLFLAKLPLRHSLIWWKCVKLSRLMFKQFSSEPFQTWMHNGPCFVQDINFITLRYVNILLVSLLFIHKWLFANCTFRIKMSSDVFYLKGSAFQGSIHCKPSLLMHIEIHTLLFM